LIWIFLSRDKIERIEIEIKKTLNT
jgi:hypothetical protein